MPRQTPHTIVAITALKAELDRGRQKGYALDAQESMEGAFCIGVPILDDAGAPIAAVSISGPVTRFNESTVPVASDAMLRAVAEIRAKLGLSRTSRT
jgi:IclR family acetate operon transcriptional repressor